MSQEKTPWFDGSVKPVHVGVYERNLKVLEGRYSYWDGKRWGCAGMSVDDAMLWRNVSSSWQRTEWRGLAQQPEGA